MKRLTFATLLALCAAAPLGAQIALPDVREGLGQVTGRLGAGLPQVGDAVGEMKGAVEGLTRLRLQRLDRLLRTNRDVIERDLSGDLARKGELLLTNPAPGAIETARAAGFGIISTETLEELGLTVVRLSVPAGQTLARAQKLLVARLPDAEISSDTLNFTSGSSTSAAKQAPPIAMPPIAMPPIATPVGVIDGGSALSVIATRGFASGAPRPSDHGSAVVSLLKFAGVGRVFVADVYGQDPAGGNALAVARALDWLLGAQVRVVSVSLVGPANPVVAHAVAAAQRKGAVIVAAVGNDGPAAPPAYPASYPGVIAVTAVDGRNRALIEAGRAGHLDYAAPGADLFASNAAGRRFKVRGTSFATPLVASRVALALPSGNVRARLDAEAIDLGGKGTDATYGRGLLCTICRPAR
ncbi:S8 family serine peptidase [Novosphingobium sp. B1]|uniref:S8 family serine peptidase n=1 Tax=Novosphingobium sp. B1 TaxID=1938756 RepID=UPI0009D8400E|nr:S8 family serine peptidase [Novosphingobium sp. B1]SMC93073.1 Subtilase family protein [Novosphingobium sp. B1]